MSNTSTRSRNYMAQIRTLFLPTAFAVVSAWAWLHWFGGSTFKPDNVIGAFNAISAVSGTLAGFLFTAISVLTSVKDSPLVARMVTTGHYRVMVTDTFICCAALLVAMTLSIALVLIAVVDNKWAIASVVLVTAFGFALTLEIGRRFWLIVTHL